MYSLHLNFTPTPTRPLEHLCYTVPIMLTIMELSLYRPQQMTVDGLHHTFHLAGLPNFHTARLFVGRLMDEVQVWAEELRGGPAQVELQAVLRFCRRCGLAQVVLPDFATLYVQWVIIDRESTSYDDGSWYDAVHHVCLVDLLPAFRRSESGSF